jgi:hypothetical protein
MSQSVEEIARDITVAWLSNNQIALNINLPEKTAEAISKVYTVVVQAVHAEKSSRQEKLSRQFG